MQAFALLTLLCGASAASIKCRSPTSWRYLGRVNPATRELTWSSTGIAFNFTGTSASVPITKITGTNAIQIVVDGGPRIVIDNVNGTSISTGILPEGQHYVEIRKKSEALYGSIFIGDPTTSDTFGTVTAPEKSIEIIGDSISVGYGLDGVFPCTSTAALDDSPLTYGALTAKNLSADYSIVAWSGKGITRNYADDGQALQPELWTRWGANDPDNSYPFTTPMDLVVINLGTNDFNYLNTRDQLNATVYANALANFTRTVQGKYPEAEVFITSSPLLSDGYPTAEEAQHTKQENSIKAAIAQVNSAKVHFVSFPTQDQSNNNIGCDYHPSASTNQQMAVILTNAILAVTG